MATKLFYLIQQVDGCFELSGEKQAHGELDGFLIEKTAIAT